MDIFKFEHNGQYQFEDGPGVYAIVNTLNNKKYIGSTYSLRKRFRQHFNDLQKQKHPNIILQRAFDKYGHKHFGFIVLERCENIVSTLLYIEQKYIDECGDYNICKEAGTTRGVPHKQPPMSEEGRRKIADANRRRKWSAESLLKKSESAKRCEYNVKQRKAVLQFDLDGNFIAEYESVSAAGKSTGKPNGRTSVKDCCNGRRMTAYNYKWRYKDDIQNGEQQSGCCENHIRFAA